MGDLDDITALTVQARCYELVNVSLVPFRNFYPALHLVVVNNGSGDECTDAIRDFARNDPHIILIMNEKNVGHGRALLEGIKHIKTPYMFLFDSDTQVLKKELLYKMRELITPDIYAVGFMVWSDRGGGTMRQHDVTLPRPAGGVKYLHPFCALISMKMYYEFPPFDDTYFAHNPSWGAPLIPAMREITDQHREDELLIHLPGLTYCGNEDVKHYRGLNRIICKERGYGPV